MDVSSTGSPSPGRDLLGSFEKVAGRGGASASRSADREPPPPPPRHYAASRPLAPHPLCNVKVDFNAKERAMISNARALDSVARRLVSETDDRLAWLQRLKAFIAEEEQCMYQRRRSCIELQMLSERHRSSVDQLADRFARHSEEGFDSLDEREAAMEQRAADLQLRIEEVAQMFQMLDTKERDMARRSKDLVGQDMRLDEMQRNVSTETRELSNLEFEIEDRRRALERREEAILLWETRLDRREAELNRAAAAHRDAAARHAVQLEAIDIDPDDQM